MCSLNSPARFLVETSPSQVSFDSFLRENSSLSKGAREGPQKRQIMSRCSLFRVTYCGEVLLRTWTDRPSLFSLRQGQGGAGAGAW